MGGLVAPYSATATATAGAEGERNVRSKATDEGFRAVGLEDGAESGETGADDGGAGFDDGPDGDVGDCVC